MTLLTASHNLPERRCHGELTFARPPRALKDTIAKRPERLSLMSTVTASKGDDAGQIAVNRAIDEMERLALVFLSGMYSVDAPTAFVGCSLSPDVAPSD
jgi:hypothetical protein